MSLYEVSPEVDVIIVTAMRLGMLVAGCRGAELGTSIHISQWSCRAGRCGQGRAQC